MVYFSENNVKHEHNGEMVQGKAMTVHKEWGVCTVYAKPDNTYFIAQGTNINTDGNGVYHLTSLWDTIFDNLKDAMDFLVTLEQDR